MNEIVLNFNKYANKKQILNEPVVRGPLSPEVKHSLTYFEQKILSESILHPFDSLKRLDELFIRYAKTKTKTIIIAFAFDSRQSWTILNSLIKLSCHYLSQNKEKVDYEKIKRNWIYLLSNSLALIAKGIKATEKDVLKLTFKHI